MSSFRYFISFFGCNPNIHACIRPILDSRFPYIRVNYTYTQERDPAELSITTGFRDAYIPMASILSGETPCDVLFFTSPVAPNGFGVSPKIFQQKGIKLIYVPYATEFLRTGYLRWFMTLPHLHADVIFASSPAAVLYYEKFRPDCSHKVHTYGFPESDILYNKGYEHDSYYQKLKKFTAGRRTLLWTPHWSVDASPHISTFLRYGSLLHKLLVQDKDVVCIVRPHPALINMLPRMRRPVKLAVCSIFEQLKQLNNVWIDESPFMVPAIAASDLLISDCSSLIQKYWVTGKPVAYTKIENTVNDEIQEQIEQAMYVIKDHNQFRTTFSQLVNGHDPLREQRADLADFFCGPHDGRCSERIINNVLESMHNSQKTAQARI